MIDFTTVTEISGEPVSKEQLQRTCNRYFWAGEHANNKDLLEVACGAGLGLNYFASIATSVSAGDISEKLVETAKANAAATIDIKTFKAESLPFSNNSFDLIVFFEAIYYLEKPEQFLDECRRVLRPDGQLLIATANKDLYDFNPSPYSHRYYGIVELKKLLNEHGFKVDFYGDSPLSSISIKQRILRPIKKLAVALNLIPKTMKGKRLLKKLVFGNPIVMPSSITNQTMTYIPPIPLDNFRPDHQHKIIFCKATRQ